VVTIWASERSVNAKAFALLDGLPPLLVHDTAAVDAELFEFVQQTPHKPVREPDERLHLLFLQEHRRELVVE
jgi:hypothetical protein